jgi:adenylyltransferase/sulfurtransferase
VIKLIVGAGDPLIGRLVLFDALKMRFRELTLKKDPACPICSENPTQRELIDYEQFCGVGPRPETSEMDFEMTVQELKERLDAGEPLTLLDVRNPQEYEVARIPGTVLIPLHELQQRTDELDPAATIVVHCHHGGRSANAVAYLRSLGYEKAINLAGGIDAWSLEVDPSVPRY